MTATNLDDLYYENGRDPWDTLLPMLIGGMALAVVGGAGMWFLTSAAPQPVASQAQAQAAASAPQATASQMAPRVATRSLAVAAPTRAAPDLFGALPDFPQPLSPPLRRSLADLKPNPYGDLAGAFGGSPRAADAAPDAPGQDNLAATVTPPIDAPLPPKREIASVIDDAPLPPARPTEFAALYNADDDVAVKTIGPPRSLEPTLAYAPSDVAPLNTPAAPNKSIFSLFDNRPQRPAGYDDTTAIYDIADKILFMPDGTRIEAHSGLGDSMDDITKVGEHAKGPTPPDLYDLQMRESPFHGISAIRLIPVGGDEAIYGREGLLAHPFMMGDNGDSNGCVSIKDYEAFLKAYQDGKIRRLAVIAKVSS